MRMRHVATLRGRLPVPAALAYARFRDRRTEGRIVNEDASLWMVHVERRWYHGEWRFRPADGGCEVQLEVWSKAHGLGRLLAALPMKRTVARLHRTWQARLDALATA